MLLQPIIELHFTAAGSLVTSIPMPAPPVACRPWMYDQCAQNPITFGGVHSLQLHLSFL